MTNVNPTLVEIAAQFLDERGWKSAAPLDRARVRVWMKSDDWEEMGATNRLLFGKDHLPRVTPPLSFDECFRFRRAYFERCLTELDFNSYQGEWADVGFDLNHQIVGWFAQLYADKTVPRARLEELKSWFKRMILESAGGAWLATAVRDHLLETRKTANFFADWRADERLQSLFG